MSAAGAVHVTGLHAHGAGPIFVGGLHQHGDSSVYATAVEGQGSPAPVGAPAKHLDPVDLGVHRAITVGDVASGLTPYVLRPHDKELRDVLRVARVDSRSMMVVVVGGSSTGKTRTLYEAVIATVPDWRVFQPRPGYLLRAIRAGIPPNTVLWLDELQDYLGASRQSEDQSLAAGYLHELIASPDSAPVLVAATIWPSYYQQLVHQPTTAQAVAGHLPRQVARLFDPDNDRIKRVRVPAGFASAEPAAVEAAASSDPRVREALRTANRNHQGAGVELTQTLAGGALLVDWAWIDAPATTRAVLAAVAELRRVGVSHAPASLIYGIAGGYLTSQELGELGEDWAAAALEHATSHEVRGIRALTPVREHGGLTQYQLHDYLYQQYLAERRCAPTRESLWNTLIEHSAELEAATIESAVEDAYSRGLHSVVLRLPLPAKAGSNAQHHLAVLLYEHGMLKTLEARAAAGDSFAQDKHVRLLIDNMAEDAVLTNWADRGDWSAQDALARRFATRGDLDRLRGRAVGGDRPAQDLMADISSSVGDVAGLQALAAAGGYRAAEYLRGDHDYGRAFQLSAPEELPELLAATSVRPGAEHVHLMDLLVARADVNLLRELADGGVRAAQVTLAELLLVRQELEALSNRACGGDWWAGERLAFHLVAAGQYDQLREYADDGYDWARKRLGEALVARQDLHALRGRAAQEDPESTSALAQVLLDRGSIEELVARAASGDLAAAQAANWYRLARRDYAAIEARASAGDADAAGWLTDIRLDANEVAEITRRADDGTGEHRQRLMEVLVAKHDIHGLQNLALGGDEEAASWWSYLLAAGQDLSGLLAALRDLHLADYLGRTKTWSGPSVRRVIASRIAWLLLRTGDDKGLRTRADSGDQEAEEVYSLALLYRGETAELQRRAEGRRSKARLLHCQILLARGEIAELEALARRHGSMLYSYHLVDALVARDDQQGLERLALQKEHWDLHWPASERLETVRIARGGEPVLRELVSAGASSRGGQVAFGAGDTLSRLLYKQGKLDEAYACADYFQRQELLKKMRVGRGLAHLRQLAHEGDRLAAEELADALGQLGDLAELRRLVQLPSRAAADKLLELHRRQHQDCGDHGPLELDLEGWAIHKRAIGP